MSDNETLYRKYLEELCALVGVGFNMDHLFREVIRLKGTSVIGGVSGTPEEDARLVLNALRSDERRSRVLSLFCAACGCEMPRCHCAPK